MPRLEQVARRGRGLARRVRGRLGRSAAVRRLRGPRLSVIVPFYNVEAYLAECLDSVLGQSFDDIEVLLVDDGSPDGSRAIAELYVAQDSRCRLVTRPNGGLGAARNTGIREAKGSFLTFVDSDDVLPEHALRALMDAAQASGSDIVVGSVERFDSLRRWRPTWVDAVHGSRRTAVTVEEFLPLLRNLYTWNKVFRRDFWDAQGLWFREGVAYEDQPIITQLLARAASIDVIPDIVYEYRARDDKSSISQQTASLADLRARIAAWQVSHETFSAELSRTVYDGWLATLFDAHFHWYLTSKGTVDDDYWRELVEIVRFFADRTPEWIWRQTSPEKRVLIRLALLDRRADAQELVRLEHGRSEKWDTTVREDGILVHLPFVDDPELGQDLFTLWPEQLRLAHAVESVRWLERDGSGWCRLAGWGFLAKVDLARFASTTSVVLRNERSGEERVFVATDRPPTAFPPPVDDFWCDYSQGTFAVDLPLEEVLASGRPDDLWAAELRVEAGGFAVSTPITRLLRSGAAGIIPAWQVGDHARLTSVWSFRQQLRFRMDTSGVTVADPVLDGRTLSGRIVDGAEVTAVEVVSGTDRATTRPGSDGAFSLALPEAATPAAGAETGWRVLARTVDGTLVPMIPRGAVDQAVVAGPTTLVLDTNRNAELVVGEWSLGAVAEEVTIRGEHLVVSGRLLGAGSRVALHSRSHKVTSVGDRVEVADGRFTASLDLRHDLFRFGRRPLPLGDHDLSLLVEGAESEQVPLLVSARLGRDLPVLVRTERHEGFVVRGPAAVVRLTLVRPIGAARGKYQQQRLRAASGTGGGLTRGILMRSYFGEQATDNGLSIQRELARRGSDLPVYWAVQDHSVNVPDGGIPVVVNSREWYDLLGSVSYYVDNMYQPEYHTKPPGQVLVQTFHGYPFKLMGHSHWRSLQVSRAKIEAYDARARAWDYLVSPARYATPLLRRDFAYDGEVLEIGYPRNDVLLSDAADDIRAVTRESLGVREGQTAVLYAPTFRDYLSADDSKAVMADFFDFARAHRRLGDDVVFLVRGHAFNARIRKRAGRRQGVIDVTDYPEVSDLYLAADAAIVDYSSLRFDFGVTGKPMIFHVPDLQRYQDTRGWLFDFEPTAPGPLLETTDEVVDALADLPAVRARHAAAYERFRKEFLDLEDGQAGRRFVDAVIAPRGDA
ncbi:bifunctional glycosyltransferase/CDP-glycerol:glycerophosphate glycerophosphotransferase [Nocardioides donggukensis]|uniref:CDP-glycerol glycerophosphotransferase family protein n=1 Tax=Nocardioides donggukensis TaxID=2774019 RepID=A0A927Q0N9_9ACTN|nr:CDP-glycerol glycerophosphotransferase family protein [Nocardioides donggukensis]MBD8870870.1 CDP-glycerol glycerophosphotransferase family protein [Nocardioides donggukensis]